MHFTDEEHQWVRSAKTRSVMGQKLYDLLDAAKLCEAVDGNVAEIGSYRGGSSLILCKVFSLRTVYLFDTFCGMPEDDAAVEAGLDTHKKGDFSDTSPSMVDAWLRENGCGNHQLVVGTFNKMASGFLNLSEKFCFVHIDADIIQTTQAAFEFFQKRLTPGGIVFFDDYGWRRCPGIKPFVDCIASQGGTIITKNRNSCYLQITP